jgi:hypothetical protein
MGSKGVNDDGLSGGVTCILVNMGKVRTAYEVLF